MCKKLLVTLTILLLTASFAVGCDGGSEEDGDASVPERFDNEIVGIDSGAEIMGTVENEVMVEYGLDEYDLVESSEAGMITEIDSRVDDEEWVVGIGWTPHWKIPEYDMKFLEDPKGIFGEAENIKALSRAGFTDDMPEVSQTLQNFYLTEDQLGELMALVEDTDSNEREVVKEWAEDNQDVISEWVPEDPDGEGETVELLYNNWTDAIASTNLIAYVLEEEMNYEVEMEMVDVAFVFEGLASGDYDAMVCAWLPLTQANYWEEYGDDLEDLGPIFEGAKLGLVVPDYVEIDSIEEMAE
ncbi:glycine betaine ABC transporter substrate-binding protein [Natranaerobius thermophilus]|uniref:Substrate-binding region of ABC-type glycine betaine transport system n=1 Tax=Natranaerobius thermophilus (strain ATCC BAA-1301 / DSM 18059 / JW/NM-WN-LF) TaxID=457570 RepID=B2A0X7_NATTJ|nr:glycine betaine ABC transporter substrate-binding protein [Natranaerobius thermophilus]ACB84600.1 Substrate-binding region of ABC-type glycine betaine transport system [Natranaerobius thermophilus JW/NM-WN-LF]